MQTAGFGPLVFHGRIESVQIDGAALQAGTGTLIMYGLNQQLYLLSEAEKQADRMSLSVSHAQADAMGVLLGEPETTPEPTVAPPGIARDIVAQL